MVKLKTVGSKDVQVLNGRFCEGFARPPPIFESSLGPQSKSRGGGSNCKRYALPAEANLRLEAKRLEAGESEAGRPGRSAAVSTKF